MRCLTPLSTIPVSKFSLDTFFYSFGRVNVTAKVLLLLSVCKLYTQSGLSIHFTLQKCTEIELSVPMWQRFSYPLAHCFLHSFEVNSIRTDARIATATTLQFVWPPRRRSVNNEWQRCENAVNAAEAETNGLLLPRRTNACCCCCRCNLRPPNLRAKFQRYRYNDLQTVDFIDLHVVVAKATYEPHIFHFSAS